MSGSVSKHRRQAVGWAAAIICLFAAAQVTGAALYRLDVSSSGDRYHVTAEAQLNADPADVHAAIMDIVHLPQISPDIHKAVVIRRVNVNAEVVYMETHICVGIFCRTLKQMQQITEISSQDIVAVTLPEGSNVQGSSSWHLQADAGGTRMYWETTLEPDFWLPPFIGPLLVREAVQEQAEVFIHGIETYATNRRTAAWARTNPGSTP